MNYNELATTLTNALNQVHSKQLEAGQYRKTTNGYIGRRKDGSYCSAFTKTEIINKVKL